MPAPSPGPPRVPHMGADIREGPARPPRSPASSPGPRPPPGRPRGAVRTRSACRPAPCGRQRAPGGRHGAAARHGDQGDSAAALVRCALPVEPRPGMRRPTVLLADDHEIVLEGLAGLLRSEFSLLGTVADGARLIEAARQL